MRDPREDRNCKCLSPTQRVWELAMATGEEKVLAPCSCPLFLASWIASLHSSPLIDSRPPLGSRHWIHQLHQHCLEQQGDSDNLDVDLSLRTAG